LNTPKIKTESLPDDSEESGIADYVRAREDIAAFVPETVAKIMG
jgi:hypothetical protein